MDIKFWSKFYNDDSNLRDIRDCSTFAKFCNTNYYKSKIELIELGSGNARDALYFASNKHTVYGIDQCADDNTNHIPNLKLIKQDFVRDGFNFCDEVDSFYSRFSLHSISVDDEMYMLPRVYDKLKPGGLFCIEARTVNDSKYKMGEHISDTTYYYNNHSRRFIEPHTFLNKVMDLNFKLKYFIESDGLSVVGDDDPALMRVILEK